MLHKNPGPSTYAHTFAAAAVPTLEAECKRLAVAVAWGHRGFDDAYTTAMRRALWRGGWRLPSLVLADLEKWICRTILKHIDAYLPAGSEQRAVSPAVIERVRAEWETVTRAASARHGKRT
jgi:hypothetical protein